MSGWSLFRGLLPHVPTYFAYRSERLFVDLDGVKDRLYGPAGKTLGVPIYIEDATCVPSRMAARQPSQPSSQPARNSQPASQPAGLG